MTECRHECTRPSHSKSAKWTVISLLLLLLAIGCWFFAFFWDMGSTTLKSNASYVNYTGSLVENTEIKYKIEYDDDKALAYGAVLVLFNDESGTCMTGRISYYFGGDNDTLVSSCWIMSCDDWTACEIDFESFWSEEDHIEVTLSNCINVWDSQCGFYIQVQYLKVLPIDESLKYELQLLYAPYAGFVAINRVQWFHYVGGSGSLEELNLVLRGGGDYDNCAYIANFTRCLTVTDKFNHMDMIDISYLTNNTGFKYDKDADYTCQWHCAQNYYYWSFYKQELRVDRNKFGKLLLVGVYMNTRGANFYDDDMTERPILRLASEKDTPETRLKLAAMALGIIFLSACIFMGCWFSAVNSYGRCCGPRDEATQPLNPGSAGAANASAGAAQNLPPNVVVAAEPQGQIQASKNDIAPMSTVLEDSI